MISINSVSVQFGGKSLFKDASFIVNPRDRIGLIGKNGAGKTTLMRLIMGFIEPESGTIAVPNQCQLGYLPQELKLNVEITVFDHALSAFSDALQLEKKIEKLTHELNHKSLTLTERDYLIKAQQLHDAQERYNLIDGYNIRMETEKVLLGLGFERQEFQLPLSRFSGGWQMRSEIARLLLSRPDVLMLDEPTNHLDIESIQWLEEFLKDYQGAVILVSHDRTFLDNVTLHTIEIVNGKLYDYKASYSKYIELRQEQMQVEKARFDNQLKQVEEIERFIERFRYKSTKARQVQSRIKFLEKLDLIPPDEADTSAIHFRFPDAPTSGKVVIEAENISKAYGEKTVLENLNFAILRGEFVAFVGRNGEGKTTLAKILTGNLDFTGKLTLGHNVSIGYFAQNQAELLDGEKTVFETIDDVAVGDIRTRVRAILGSFLFSGDTIDKKVKILSGGEKARLALAQLLLTPVNLLVLDEPTHHLDMVSKDILKNALLRYNGTLIIVSHDRDFLQGLTDRVFEFKNKGIKPYIGDVFEFLQSRKIENLKELEKAIEISYEENNAKAPSEQALNYEKRKEKDRIVKRLKNKINQIEQKISDIENQIKRMDEMFSSPDNQADWNNNQLYDQYQQLKNNLSFLLDEWEQTHEQLMKEGQSE